MLSGVTLKGRYSIYGELGQGGAATVYLARDAETGKVVVVKVIHPNLVDERFIARFEREIDLLEQLESPYFVRLLDWALEERDEGTRKVLSYVVTEFVQGHTLSELIEKQGKMDEAAALAITRQVALALSEIHGKGIVHRDVKSENVMITPENDAKLIDFGTAKGPDHATLTDPSYFWGTLLYAPPEQMEETHQVDHRADIYALGVVLYEMLMGRMPVEETEFWMVVNRIMENDLDPIVGVSEPVAALVNEMMARDVEARTGSAEEVVRRIEAILGEATGPALPERAIAPDETMLVQQLEEAQEARPDGEEIVRPTYFLTTGCGRRIPLVGQETVIGRSQPEEIVAPYVDLRALGAEGAQTVSRQHCRLFLEGDALFVEDLGSMNGTRLKGVPLEPGRAYGLTPGDVMHVGDVALTLESSDTTPGRERLIARMLRAVSPGKRG